MKIQTSPTTTGSPKFVNALQTINSLSILATFGSSLCLITHKIKVPFYIVYLEWASKLLGVSINISEQYIMTR